MLPVSSGNQQESFIEAKTNFF